MVSLCCKSCGVSDFTKKGLVRGLQRYKCRGCGCHFTLTPPRGKPTSMKALAVLLYGMGNMSFGMIGRLLQVSRVTVLRWVRAEAESLPEPVVPAETVMVVVDEMWHFIGKKAASSGSGERMTLSHGELWPGFWVGVMMRPAVNYATKSG
jgi:transposase-like protein